MVRIPCTIMRGGTSKGVYFRSDALPTDAAERDRLLLRIMGSPDARQIDGLGGADPLTSKIVIMDPKAPEGCDATYTYGRVSVLEPYIGYATNCGNLSAAAAVYAIEEGFVPVAKGAESTPVRLYNSNTDRVLVIHVPTDGKSYVAEGDFHIDGVPGTGSEIRLDFSATAGANIGKLLPLGAPTVPVHVPRLGRSIDVSVVDVAKTTLFVRAEDLGLRGNEMPDAVSSETVETLWSVRDAVGQMLGLGEDKKHIPTPVAIGPAQDYVAFGGSRAVSSAEMDFCARAVGRRGHGMAKASSGTGAVCTAAAAVTRGTIVNAHMANPDGPLVRIGHASGILPLRASYGADGQLKEALFSRTARRLMDGFAYA
ncbi:MAG TPA: PrpF domain-containing protein [Devosia sp.]|nr:PrpF domain-containing protein [Devosia sp.]